MLPQQEIICAAGSRADVEALYSNCLSGSFHRGLARRNRVFLPRWSGYPRLCALAISARQTFRSAESSPAFTCTAALSSGASFILYVAFPCVILITVILQFLLKIPLLPERMPVPLPAGTPFTAMPDSPRSSSQPT
jgi:hypothetical protein